MAKTVKLTAPLTDQDVLQLNIGDTVLVSGVIYTARDAAHKLLVDMLAKGEPLPMDLADATLVALADAVLVPKIFTLDHKDFSIYRFKQKKRFTLIPSKI